MFFQVCGAPRQVLPVHFVAADCHCCIPDARRILKDEARADAPLNGTARARKLGYAS